VGGHQAGKPATRLVVIPLFMGFWVGDQYMFHEKTSFLIPFWLKACVWAQLADITTHAMGDPSFPFTTASLLIMWFSYKNPSLYQARSAFSTHCPKAIIEKHKSRMSGFTVR